MPNLNRERTLPSPEHFDTHIGICEIAGAPSADDNAFSIVAAGILGNAADDGIDYFADIGFAKFVLLGGHDASLLYSRLQVELADSAKVYTEASTVGSIFFCRRSLRFAASGVMQ